MRAIFVIVAAAVASAGCVTPTTTQGADEDVAHAAADLACDHETYATPDVAVDVATSHGAFRLLLEGDRAPLTVCNFLRYAEEGFYDGTIFHRICDGFVVQAGGFEPDLVPITGSYRAAHEPIGNEAKASGLNNTARTISMARTAEPDSATSHFFLNLVDHPHLDPGGADEWGYAVFGSVVDGWDAVEAIAGALVRPDPQGGCPGDNWLYGFQVTIESVAVDA